MPEATRPRSDARIYKAITEMEHRLMDRLDQGIQDVKELVQERKKETAELEEDLRRHRESDGHPLLAARVSALELAQAKAQQRPMQMWQVVSVIGFILLNMASLIVSIVSLLHTLAR